jgi:hypothetical protein
LQPQHFFLSSCHHFCYFSIFFFLCQDLAVSDLFNLRHHILISINCFLFKLLHSLRVCLSHLLKNIFYTLLSFCNFILICSILIYHIAT